MRDPLHSGRLRCLIKCGEFDAFVGLVNPSMRTRRMAVGRGRWCRSEVCTGRMRSMLCGAVAAFCCCTV